MQKKSERVPNLTERDAGELENYRPKLPITMVTWIIKRLWAEGYKQGEISRLTGTKKDYVKKYTACFSRALRPSPIRINDPENTEKEVQYEPKKQPKIKEPKKRKSLTVNFATPITKKMQREYMKRASGEGINAPKGAKLIPLTKGYFAFVSDADFIELSQHKWSVVFCRHTNYAIRYDRQTKRRIWMHRQILKLSDRNVLTDHRNGNGLDNRRENIRPCSAKENARNQRLSKRNTSGFKGVSWKDADLRWQAKIRFEGKYIHLGHFISVIDAAKAYNEAAKKYHGEFANINKLPE